MEITALKARIILFLAFLLMYFQPVNSQWNLQSSGVTDALYGVYCVNSSIIYAAGWGSSSGGVILRSTNSGGNWSSTIPVTGAFLFGITFINPNTGFVVGYSPGPVNGLILRTTNGGNNWTTTLLSGTFGFYMVQFLNSTTGYACGYQGAVFKTTNGGDNWEIHNAGTSEVVKMLSFADVNTGYVVSGSSFSNPNKIRKTTDGGSNWSLVADLAGSMTVAAIEFIDANTGIITGVSSSGEIRKTTNGGVNWVSKYTGTGSFVIQAVDISGNMAWGAGDGGRVFRSTNTGESWVMDATVSGSTGLLSISDFGNVSVFTVGAGGRIFKRDPFTGMAQFSNEIPEGYSLEQNYPNPFNPVTVIEFSIPERSFVNLAVYDVTGKEIAVLLNAEMGAGKYKIDWISENYPGGIYFYRITSGGFSETKKMALIK